MKKETRRRKPKSSRFGKHYKPRFRPNRTSKTLWTNYITM